MTTRISATFPASDGSAPENIEVTWDEEHRQPSVDELVALIQALAQVPRRYDVPRLVGLNRTHRIRETGTDRDEATLPAGTGGPIHGETPTEGAKP